MKPPILEISNLRVQRGSAIILDGISWRIEPGQHWVILGANGSGKTSLLAALTGYLTPTSGGIAVMGRLYGQTDWRELRKQIGLVSSAVRQMMPDDEPALETIISGRYAMIDFWGRATAKDRAAARRILSNIECAHIADRPWRVLSQGERQRVLIGRALMAKPRLLILDEPCAGLDPAAREHFLRFLQRLGTSANGPTLVLVTHHTEEIMPVFSHVLVLKHGGRLAGGRISRLLDSKLLATAFDTKLRVNRSEGRYRLRMLADSRKVI